jgi:hypothetical protein
MLSSGIISSTLGWEAIFYIQVHSRENVCMCVAVLLALLSVHSECGTVWVMDKPADSDSEIQGADLCNSVKILSRK